MFPNLALPHFIFSSSFYSIIRPKTLQANVVLNFLVADAWCRDQNIEAENYTDVLIIYLTLIILPITDGDFYVDENAMV